MAALETAAQRLNFDYNQTVEEAAGGDAAALQTLLTHTDSLHRHAGFEATLAELAIELGGARFAAVAKSLSADQKKTLRKVLQTGLEKTGHPRKPASLAEGFPALYKLLS